MMRAIKCVFSKLLAANCCKHVNTPLFIRSIKQNRRHLFCSKSFPTSNYKHGNNLFDIYSIFSKYEAFLFIKKNMFYRYVYMFCVRYMFRFVFKKYNEVSFSVLTNKFIVIKLLFSWNGVNQVHSF